MTIRLLSHLACAALLGACASATPRWDSQFGQSVRAATAAQAREPAPRGAGTEEVDGPAAAAAMQRYRAAAAQAKPQAGARPQPEQGAR